MFDQLCYDSLGIGPPNPLDEGIEVQTWKPSDGVSPEMLNYICNKLKISCYAFDFTNKCFLKTISKTRNYDTLVYYCINNHMY